MEIEQGTFTPLVFTTTGRMADECVKYHSRLAELIANKKGESYSSAISWIRAEVSFAIVRFVILRLRGSRSRRRQLDFAEIFKSKTLELSLNNFFSLFFLSFFILSFFRNFFNFRVSYAFNVEKSFFIEMDCFN